ncbi:Eukaryotic peptide chain release factor subunit 1-1 [Raphanus sativus]|uniref:Eukaryotic peptide chain release factor subunit 1-1 n=1 Tax=Raphanus sativus TaxID=3726 RepID=A0A6J0MTZ2_RAPSA|nr:eukaryotic peptide chain release factor subunit 1-1 [Raphanus sativus]KAJ4906904.1 Eukaryotic peptide chain release factor subunit 1-1 [Raphanus sativus]
MGDTAEGVFGFIVIDRHGALFGTLSRTTREVLHKFSVDLPGKHARGGVSALQFAKIRKERCDLYIRKAAELVTQYYINPLTGQPNVAGLILAGSADLKTELRQSHMFDPRLEAKILKVVDVSYGGESGFDQAIELSSEILGDVGFIREKALVRRFLEEISRKTGRYVYGVDDTLNTLVSGLGAVETLIVWQDLDINRYVLNNNATGENVIKYLDSEQEGNEENFIEGNIELVVVENTPLVEWLANEHVRFGCALEFVTDMFNEGRQFIRGFGGIGGILHHRMN